MSEPHDPRVPGYVMADLRRMLVRIGANERWYEQQWLGVPIWQLPEDLMRLQQIVVELRPKWIVETGTKFGGSAIFFASLLEMLDIGDGGVITVDLVRSPEAAETLKNHPHGHRVKSALIGDAASEEIMEKIRQTIASGTGRTLVFLDDNHNAEHVYREMLLYAPLVTADSYLIVADTVFEDLAGTPVGTPTDKYPDVARSNPRAAIARFLAERNDFFRDTRFMGRGIGNFDDGFLRKK
jgi:cephalosporin hydroxylase